MAVAPIIIVKEHTKIYLINSTIIKNQLKVEYCFCCCLAQSSPICICIDQAFLYCYKLCLFKLGKISTISKSEKELIFSFSVSLQSQWYVQTYFWLSLTFISCSQKILLRVFLAHCCLLSFLPVSNFKICKFWISKNCSKLKMVFTHNF